MVDLVQAAVAADQATDAKSTQKAHTQKFAFVLKGAAARPAQEQCKTKTQGGGEAGLTKLGKGPDSVTNLLGVAGAGTLLHGCSKGCEETPWGQPFQGGQSPQAVGQMLPAELGCLFGFA